jgi:hypothetical protein
MGPAPSRLNMFDIWRCDFSTGRSVSFVPPAPSVRVPHFADADGNP